MSVLVCGAIAYDTLFSFNGQFQDQILPDQLHKISTTFLTPSMRREFGGMAGNIAYSLCLLGFKPIVMGTVGDDFEPYRQHLIRSGVDDRFIRRIPGQYTTQCFSIADKKGNQLMALHPGAMDFAIENHVHDIEDKIDLAILSPGGHAAFIQHSQELYDQGIPFIFDPGQELPLLNAEEIRKIISLSTYVAINDYESELIYQKAGLSIEDIRSQVQALIVTRGSKGADIYTPTETFNIGRVQMPVKPVDPMGCGDAFRAGLIYGIIHKLDWLTTGRLANVIGAIKVTKHGCQNHYFDWTKLKSIYFEAYQQEWPEFA